MTRGGLALLSPEIDQLNGLFCIKRLPCLKGERQIKRFEKVSRSS